MLSKLLLLIFFSLRAEANSALSFTTASSEIQHEWRRLLHFEGDHSKVSSKEFFLSSEKTLSSEWDSTLKALQSNRENAGFFPQPVACTFVARRKFFERLGLLQVRKYTCQDYDEWREGIDAKGVALIFSSYYPNNPASHFGHTFLRLKKERFNNDLLDYAISYSALIPKDEPSVLYALRGIFGGYQGHFDFSPYYTMVGIYNNNESRDLLEYDLHFTQEETDRLVDHVWELYSSASFTYYFLDENCSSVLGGLLEYAKLDWNLSKSSTWYYLPSELVRRVARSDSKITRTARPSLKRQALMRSEMAKGEKQTSALALDAELARLQFKKFKSKNQLSASEVAHLKETLRQRASLVGEYTKELDYHPSYPESGHLPRALTVASALSGSQSEFIVGLKQGYHNLYDNDRGLAQYSGFDFLEVRALYNQNQKKVRLDRARIIDIYSAHPMSLLDPQLSWRLRIGRERAYETPRNLWYRHEALAAVGVSWVLSDHLFSLMAGVAANESKASYKRGGAGFNFSSEMIFSFGGSVKFGVSAEHSRMVTSDFNLSSRSFIQGKLALNLWQNFALHLWSRYDHTKQYSDSLSSALELVGRF